MQRITKTDLRKCKLSRLELAKIMGMQYPTFCAKINGYLNFSPEELEKLRAILEVNKIDF